MTPQPSLMRRGFLTSIALVLASMFTVGAGAESRITGPFEHHNLAVYLVHGAAATDAKVLTLDAALAGGQVILHETGSVNELSVENVSSDQTVLIQAGEIVKGGRQDRVLSQDLVLAPKSGRVPLAAFCVESGRWSRRGSESADSFASSKHNLASKELKLAARRAKNQQAVWSEVAALQEKLAGATGSQIASDESATSLQLSLENQQLAETRVAYLKKLEGLLEGKSDVLGFVMAVNGEISSAELYASPGLLRQVWSKHLGAAATEAIAAMSDPMSSSPQVAAVDQFLDEASKGAKVDEGAADSERSEVRETEATVYFESRSGAEASTWLHRSYIAK